ncbi:Serine palmitoyltransferase 1 [Cymbomonas tetramitiformis]|uniref:serine C-palmitoyltransferase n=1 Tax=Cymbomonas tetramitiformis TaxID=36881 RepID=A0AAE0KT44_9CHLO|nr:Serine palmitoyltransferase 1 [Cymbomonas tetramitiformis]|eukprot:gene4414-5422_t
MDYSADTLKCETVLRNRSMYRYLGHTTATYFQYGLYVGEASCKNMYNTLRGIKDWRKDDAEALDFAPIAVGKDFYYIRNLYGSIEDTFNRPVTSSPDGWIDVAIRERENTGGYFSPLRMTGETRRCLNLGSYNYLGFGGVNDYCTPSVEEAIQSLPISSCSTLAEQGYSKVHEELESMVARYLGKPAAMVVGMGFGTNSLVLPALVGKGDLILSDAQNHKSIVEGARMSGASIKAFRHDDVAHLEHQLQEAVLGKANYGKVLVVIEGIYSMEGELCSLPDIIKVCKMYGAYVYLDEAHSIGAVGQTGRGVTEELGVDPSEVDIMMGTFTKSFGAVGGYVAGNPEIVAQIRQYSAGCTEAVSMAPACCVQIMTALRVMSGEDGSNVGATKVQQLRDNSQFFREGLKALGLEVLGHFPSPVMPVMLYQPFKIGDFARLAFEKNIAVVVVGAPAVSILLPRVRFCLSAAHTREDMEMALKAISEIADTMSLRFKIHPPNPLAPGTIENDFKEALLLSEKTATTVALNRAKALEAARCKTWAPLGVGQVEVALQEDCGWAAGGARPEEFDTHMSSTDYLGLRADPALAQRCLATVRRIGVGACSPRGFYGTFPEHLKLEADVARFLGVDEAVLYSFGACTISSVIPSICKTTDVAVVDSGVSYGTLVGLRLAKVKLHWYNHCDAADAARVLEELEAEDGTTSALLRRKKSSRTFIITESVFQGSGMIAPLAELAELRLKHKARIILEESHSFGCLGTTGRGLTEHLGLPVTSVDVIVASLEGAGASVGGFAAGASGVVNFQRLMGSGYVFSAALPPYLATASSYALEVVQTQPQRLALLRESSLSLWEVLQKVPGLCTTASQGSPVLPVRLAAPSGNVAEDRAMLAAVAREVQAEGILVCLAQESHLTGVKRQAGNLAHLPHLRLIASAAQTPDAVARFGDALRLAATRVGLRVPSGSASSLQLECRIPRNSSLSPSCSSTSVHTPYGSTATLDEMHEGGAFAEVTKLGMKAEAQPIEEVVAHGEEPAPPTSLTVPVLCVLLWLHTAMRRYIIGEIISTERMAFNMLRSCGALPSQGNAGLSMVYTTANFMASRQFYLLAAPILIWLTECTQASTLVLFYCFNCVVGFVMKSALATLASSKHSPARAKVLSWPSIASMNATGLPFFILRQRFGSMYLWDMEAPALCALAYSICLAWLLLVTVSRVRAGDTPADVQGGVVAGAVTLRVMAYFMDDIQAWLESGSLTAEGGRWFLGAAFLVVLVFPLPVDLKGNTATAATSCYTRTLGMLAFAITFICGSLARAAQHGASTVPEYHMATSLSGVAPRLLVGFALLYTVMILCTAAVRNAMERALLHAKGCFGTDTMARIRNLCFDGISISQRAVFGGAVSLAIPAVFDAIGV